MSKAPDDKKNLFRKNFPRFSVQSGQSSIHGDTNFEVQTQEAQSFAFHASTGEGASEGGGPGTGKAVLYTPGLSSEVLGEGLKVRDAGDIVQLPAKIIKCKTVRLNNLVPHSSRNSLLTKKDIYKSAFVSKSIHKFYFTLKKDFNKINNIHNLKNIIKSKKIKTDYLEIRNKNNLSKKFNRKNFKIFIAYYLKNVRLIDNI